MKQSRTDAEGMMSANSAQEFAGLMVCAGLAQNLGAMRALATKGIQEGHMRLHLRNMVMSAGATPDEVDDVANAVRQEGGNITQSLVDAKLEEYRNQS